MMKLQTKDGIAEVLAWLIFMAAFVIALSLCSCSTRYITVPEYHYENHSVHDTISKADTLWRERNTVIREADSSMVAGLGIRLKDGERAILILRNELERAISQQREVLHDTVIKIDSLRVPFPVEKQLNRWETLKMQAGGYVFALLVILFIVFVVYIIRNRGVVFRRPRDGL
jgi:hypothetical protein